MAGWTKKNFADVTDRSPDDTMEWRMSRGEVGSQQVDGPKAATASATTISGPERLTGRAECTRTPIHLRPSRVWDGHAKSSCGGGGTGGRIYWGRDGGGAGRQRRQPGLATPR